MKMKKLFYIAAAAVTLASCEGFLTADNKSSVTADQQFSTLSGFESLVNDAYAVMRPIYNNVDNYNFLFQAGTDMYTLGRGNATNAFHEYLGLNPDNSTVNTFYTNCYDGIRAAYQVLYYAPNAKVTDELRNKRVDEARVIAAHYYYLLVNTFGGVPLIKKFVDAPSTGYPRAKAEDVYEWIISELEEVVSNNNLEASTATKGGGRVSMEAAKAQLAQAYLSAAWDLKNDEYFTKAAKYADEVIAGRSLTTPYADLYKTKYHVNDYSGDDDPEFIWDVEYDWSSAHNQSNGGHSWSGAYCGYLGGSEDNIKAVNTNFMASIHALESFEKGDLRYDVTFVKELPELNANNAAGTGYYTWYEGGESLVGHPVQRYYSAWYETDEDFEAWKALDPDNRANTYRIPMAEQTKEPQNMDGTNMDYQASLSLVYGGGACKKFDDAHTATKTGGNNWHDIHIINLPEMFFVAAEAYLKSNDVATAAQRISTVRERAGLSKVTTVDLDDIMKERSCELFGMGKRWFDLRRTGLLEKYNEKYNPFVGSNAAAWVKWLRPIPQGAIDANDQLSAADQNPGY
ncbi:MAG: RagB/SusD family nutrient uptake outer membrane protein [Alistipes sp.]|nr:RagB/SusD family nutrient uptake outer membrane protein [Alistipes sp.]